MESFKSIKIFNLQNIFSLKKIKITCVEFLNDEILLIGTKNGYLYLYQIQENNYIEVSDPIKICKFPIQKLIPLIKESTILIKSETMLYIYLIGNNKNKYFLIDNQCVDFSILNTINEINLAIVGNGKITLYLINKERLNDIKKDDFKITREIKINYKINKILWIDKNIFISIENKDYAILNSDKGDIKLMKMENNFSPFIIKINLKEIILIIKVKQDFLGIFVDEYGKIINRNTLNINNERMILSIYYDKNFIVILTNKSILIFDIKNSQLLQKIPNKNFNLLNMTSNKNMIIISNGTDIYKFNKNSIESIIDSCIEINDYKKGISIINCFNLNKIEEYKELEPQIFLQCGFKSLSQQKFIAAEECFYNINFDPIELIEVVYNEYSIKFKDSPKISIYNKNSLVSFKNILMNKRNKLINNYNTEDKVYYYQEKREKTNKNIWLNYIDYALVKIFIDLKNYDELIEFYKKNQEIYCELSSDKLLELINMVEENKNLNLDKKYVLIGILNFLLLDYNKGLDYLRKGYQKTQNDKILISELAIKFLLKIQNNRSIFFNMIKEHLDWISINNIDGIGELFNKIKIDIILPEEIFRKIFNKEENNLLILESFLFSMIFHHKIKLEIFHLELINLYLNISVKNASEEYFKKFKNFLFSDLNSLSKPNFIKILDKIKVHINDNFMKNKKNDILLAEIFLNRKLGNHELIIKKIILNKEFAIAEDYCSNEIFNNIKNTKISNEKKLLNILLKEYIFLLNDEDNEFIEKDLVIKLISKFLKKFAGHPQLDISNVLEILPENLLINENDLNIVEFLKSSLEKKYYERRIVKSKRQISEVYLQNINHKVVMRKKAYVIIGENTKCMQSKNLIGDKVFDVYPNGSLILHNKNLKNNKNICPITNQNFKIFNKIN